MRIPEIYGVIITLIIYFLIIKEYRFNKKLKRRKNEIQEQTLQK